MLKYGYLPGTTFAPPGTPTRPAGVSTTLGFTGMPGFGESAGSTEEPGGTLTSPIGVATTLFFVGS